MNEGINLTSYLLGKKAGGGGEPPVYEEKNVSITQNGDSTITADSGYDAISKVNLSVNVPQPSGKITITQNGTNIDVSSYASADVNVPAGADLSEYFNDTITGTSIYVPFAFTTIFKKIPPLTATGTSLNNAFKQYPLSVIPNIDASNINYFESLFSTCSSNGMNFKLDLSGWTFGNRIDSFKEAFAYSDFIEVDLSSLGTSTIATSLNSMFYYMSNLTKVNMSNFNTAINGINANGMFYKAKQLTELDISSLDCNKITSYSNMFGSSASDGPADNCLILVKDQTSKSWFTTNFPRFTNVQIKGA